MSESISCIQSLKGVEGSRYPSVCLFGFCVVEVKESEWVICDSFNEKKKKSKQNHGMQLKYEMVAKGEKRD